MNSRGAIAAVLFLLLIAPASVQAASVPPAPTEDGVWVIDAANVLTDSEFDWLNMVCNDLYLETGRPIVVLTIESFGGQGAYGWGEEEYANFAFDEYGIMDDAGQDKAILVFMSEGDRRFWTELGGGYAGENRDAYVQSVFDNDVKPLLGDDLWYEGLLAAVNGMEPVLKGEDFNWISWMWMGALPILLVMVLSVAAFQVKRAHTPHLKAWGDAAPSAFLDIRAINRAIISNIAVSKEDGLTERQVERLNKWGGVIGDEMRDPMINTFRKLDKILGGSDFDMSLEKYQAEMENVRNAKKLEQAFGKSAGRLQTLAIIISVVTFLILYSLGISLWHNGNYNIFGAILYVVNTFWYIEDTALVGCCCGLPLVLLVGTYIWTHDSYRTAEVSIPEDDLDEEMQLVEGMDFFSMDDEDWGSGDYSHDHSHYHWSYSGSSVSFRDTAGSTSAERAAAASSSSGGGGGGGFGCGGGGRAGVAVIVVATCGGDQSESDDRSEQPDGGVSPA